MERILLTVGIISFIALALSFLFFALNWYGYYHILDGTAEQLARLKKGMTVSLVIGIALAAVGIACFVIRAVI